MNQPTDESFASTVRKLPRNVWVVTATSFLTDISSEMLVHLLPLFLANILGGLLCVAGRGRLGWLRARGALPLRRGHGAPRSAALAALGAGRRGVCGVKGAT